MSRRESRPHRRHPRRDDRDGTPQDASHSDGAWPQQVQHALPARPPPAPFAHHQQGYHGGEHGGYGAPNQGDSYRPDYGTQTGASSFTAVNRNWTNGFGDFNMGYGGVYGQVPLPQVMPYGMGAGFGYQGNGMPFPMPMPPPFFLPGVAPPFPPLPPFGFPNPYFGQAHNFSTQAYNHYEPAGMRGGSGHDGNAIQNGRGSGNGKRDKRKRPKIPTERPVLDPQYHTIAREPLTSLDDPQPLLVILDLNGTLVYRPNPSRQPTKIEHRLYLREFLQYLFSNFSVMVWSSARPQNVQSMTDQVLPRDQCSALVARWARDSFGLSPQEYDQNVQVYKDLRLVWASDDIQQQHPQYAHGARWDQRNTVLIDDSLEKAFAQPHNLIDIPEFEGVPRGAGPAAKLEQRVLKELAGYLEHVRYQKNVSSFMREKPFAADGEWWYEWPRMEGVVEPKAELDGGVKVEVVADGGVN